MSGPWDRKLSVSEAEAYLGGQTMDLFRQQLLLCAVNRLGGCVTIPVAEVDSTGNWMMDVEVDQAAKTFTLKTSKKQ